MTEDELFTRLAQRPFDDDLRSIIADWWSEQGDPRGEVVAASHRGDLKLSERRRVRQLVEKHSRGWLGPLRPIADPAASTFVGGFLDSLVLNAAARSVSLNALSNEPRLATVRALDVSVMRKSQPLSTFLRQPALRSLRSVVAGPAGLQALEGEPVPFTLSTLGVSDHGFFEDALVPLKKHVVAQRTPTWSLVSPLLLASDHARELFACLRPQLDVVARVPELRLVARYGVFEGFATWLCRPAEEHEVLQARWPRGERWGVDSPLMSVTLHRDEHERWPRLDVEMSGEGMLELDHQMAKLTSLLVLLRRAELTEVHVALPRRATATREHLMNLKLAARRLRGVSVTVGGEVVAP
jgi:uncharacterized protein (TIGR02996 family)